MAKNDPHRDDDQSGVTQRTPSRGNETTFTGSTDLGDKDAATTEVQHPGPTGEQETTDVKVTPGLDNVVIEPGLMLQAGSAGVLPYWEQTAEGKAFIEDARKREGDEPPQEQIAPGDDRFKATDDDSRPKEPQLPNPVSNPSGA